MPSAGLESDSTRASPKNTDRLAQEFQPVQESASQTAILREAKLRQCPSLNLQRAIGNRGVGRILAPKLRIGEPGDIYEQEADRVADQVMRSTTPDHIIGTPPQVQLKCAPCEATGTACPKCEEEENTEQLLHRSPSGARASPEVPPVVYEVLRSPGDPLDANARAFFEPRFGYDFSNVRVHTDEQAAGSAKAVNARAYTVENNIFFGEGEYTHGTRAGRWLLAHELTHVVQQTGGSVPSFPSRAHVHVGAEKDSRPLTHAPASVPSAPAGMVQPQVLGPSLAGYGLNKLWSTLSPQAKAEIVDTLIDIDAASVDLFPGKIFLGDAWQFIEAGLLGFYAKLRSSPTELKVQAMDKVVAIAAGTDEKFSMGFLKGLLKGFFVDGALGIFFAIADLIKGLGGLWDFIKSIGETIGGFPEYLALKLLHFQEKWQELKDQIGPAIVEFATKASDPKQAQTFLNSIVEAGKGIARSAGESVAESLLNFFSKPEASGEIGEAVGDVVGIALWEVAFAVVTEGGGAAVTAVKGALKEAAEILGKIFGKIVSGILKIVEEIRAVFTKVVDGVKAAVKFVAGKLREVGGKFAELLEEVGGFFADLLANCHESKLACKFRTQFAALARRIAGTDGLIHSFDSHAAQWFGRAVNRGTHLGEWQALIERAAQSGKVFEWEVGNAKTVAHLANFENKPFIVQFFKEGPRAGELATAFVPNQGQLAAMLAKLGI